MTVKNSEIYGAYESLQQLTQMDLPVKTSFKLAKLANYLGPLYHPINQVREGLVRKFGNPVEKSANFSIQPTDEKWPEFIHELNELMEQENEVDFEKVLLPSEVNGKPFIVKPSILIMLEKFIELEP